LKKYHRYQQNELDREQKYKEKSLDRAQREELNEAKAEYKNLKGIYNEASRIGKDISVDRQINETNVIRGVIRTIGMGLGN
jgi:sortase (surface protein transpeptidase)